MSKSALLRLDERVWAEVERGELGEAFRSIGEAAGSDERQSDHELIRAELQAYCGNEDAALAVLEDLGQNEGGGEMVRARVAAARGDWLSTERHALNAAESSRTMFRALLLAAEADLELGRTREASGLLDRFEPTSGAEALHLARLRAIRSGDADLQELAEIGERAGKQGAVRASAEAWADLSALHGVRGNTEHMQEAAMRALELWDDMATSLPPPLRAGFWRDARRRRIRDTVKHPSRQSPRLPPAELATLVGNLRRLASERDLDPLLTLITDGAIELSGAERGFVLLVDQGGALEAKTIRSAERELGERTVTFSRSIAEMALIDGEPMVTVDAVQDSRVKDYLSVHQLMLKSVACLPIRSRRRTWGVLYLEHRSASGRFTGANLEMLRAFADQAALAIETSTLFERIEAQKRELEEANLALREANETLERQVEGQSKALARTREQLELLRGPDSGGERWGLVGISERMRRVYAVLERVAQSEVPVVITGESGTGKELVARAIHRSGARASKRYVSLNCGAIPEGLLESELFGHAAGAFTGAGRAREGVFQQAHGGTLFLDEIADMPARMQLDLLRILQERRVRPLGASEENPVDVRLLAAAKRPLRELIEEGTLREDLYYRLAVVELKLPPLRERPSDIPLLCDHFLQRIAEERSEPKKRLSPAALQRLAAHGFPGNVRELEHLLIHATVFAATDVIEADELAIAARDTPPQTQTKLENYRDFKKAERERILGALNAHDWNRARTARALGMARRTFYRRLKEHGIELPASAGPKR